MCLVTPLFLITDDERQTGSFYFLFPSVLFRHNVCTLLLAFLLLLFLFLVLVLFSVGCAQEEEECVEDTPS